MAEFQENNIEFLKGFEQATCTFTQGRFINRVKNLAKKYPDECEIVAENKDGSICAHIPVKWVKISPPPKRELTEEQKQVLRDRLKSIREQ